MNKYPLNSAGRNMVKNIPICHQNDAISDVREMLLKTTDALESINYVYVIDKNSKLIGVFSVKDIFRRSQAKVKEIMETELVKAKLYTDQERVAILALQKNLKSIPVVDKNNKLMGVVPSDIILDILNTENIEDFLRMTGINSPLQKLLKGSAWYLFKVRIPWLMLGLLGGILGATIISYFEGPLKEHFVLAGFIPLMLYMSGAVGNQTEVLFIRNTLLDNKLGVTRYFFREIRTGFLIALCLVSFLFLVSFIFFKASYYISIILGLSLFLAIFSAITIGIFMPCVLRKFGKDPAIGSGPFAAIMRDILALIIYFLVASILL